MAPTSMLHVRVDDELKTVAAEKLASVGLTISDAVRILLTRVAKDGGLPMLFVCIELAGIAVRCALKVDEDSQMIVNSAGQCARGIFSSIHTCAESGHNRRKRQKSTLQNHPLLLNRHPHETRG